MRRSPATLFAALLLAGCAAVPVAEATAQALTLAPLPESVPSDLPRNARPLQPGVLSLRPWTHLSDHAPLVAGIAW